MTTVRPRRRHGFTLIELLVVLGIIVILVGLLIPGIARIRRAAYGAATLAQLTAIANAVQQYYGDFHAYPGPLPNNQIGQTLAGVATPIVPTADGVAMTYPSSAQYGNITGGENLVLGLLGGLELSTPAAGGTPTFVYDPTNIFTLDTNSVPNGVAPKGPLSLNYAKPSRKQSYIQVNRGDISEPNPNLNNGQYTDDAGRPANDSVIPEFMDKFSNHPMPILYMRANPGGTAVADIGGKDDGGTALQDANGNAITAQWDLQQVMGYTTVNSVSSTGAIGTKAGSATADHHGLQGLGTGGSGGVAMTDTITGTPSPATGWYNAGKNALAYLKDPTANSTTATNIGGIARQKDGFILISAGPDGIYGTADDIIYPGSLNP